MMRVVSLTRAAASDLDDVTALEASGFDRGAWSRQAWADEIEGADRRVVVARSGGHALGVATFQAVPGSDVADLHRVVVAPEHRGQRVADDLLVDGERWARDAGARRMLLEVDENNASALALYRRRGFAEVARRDDYYGPGAHALVMAKELGDE